MNWFSKLPGFAKAPSGVEVEILRLVPIAFLLGTLMIALPSLVVRISLWPETEGIKLITTVDFFAIGAMIVHWIVLLTVSFGAFIVRVMKGPAYVADAYPLSDAESPSDRKLPGFQ